MRVVVACLSLNSLGGAERLCVHFLKALEGRDVDVTLATVDRTNWAFLKKFMEGPCKPLREVYLFNRMPELPTLMLRQAFIALLYVLELYVVTLKGGYDLLINMRGEVVDSIGDLVYFNAMPLRLMHIYPQIQPKQGAIWGVYSRMYSLLMRVFRNPRRVIVSNSRFNKRIIERHLGKQALVVHPPVELDRIRCQIEDRDRENVVVTVSRFRLAKGLETIPEIATLVENCKFVLIGTSDRDSEECLSDIFERTRRLRVEEKVQVFENKSFDFALEKLLTAKVFLHTQRSEAFGMAIVESMAAGCVPIVPKSGGPWCDTLDSKNGQYGFSYESTGEAAEKIGLILENDRLRREISARAQERASAFDSSVFEERILRIVERVYQKKTSCV